LFVQPTATINSCSKKLQQELDSSSNSKQQQQVAAAVEAIINS